MDNSSPVLARAWHVVALSAEVGDEPVQVWLLNEPWVLVRLDGSLSAFRDECPHRLAPLSAGTVLGEAGLDHRLQCGYHGWQFDGSGRCRAMPPIGKTEDISRRANLVRPFGLCERYGLVWLAPKQALSPIPDFPEWEADGFDSVMSTIVRTTAGAAQLVDNFLDASHFPYVHRESFGVPEAARVIEAGIERKGWGVETTFSTWVRERDKTTPQELLKAGSVSYSIRLKLTFPEFRSEMGILFCCQPETSDRTRIYKLMARNDLNADPGLLADFRKEEDDILAEDLVILERYQHRGIHLDNRKEMHTRADRLSLAWRQLMREAAGDQGEAAAVL